MTIIAICIYRIFLAVSMTLGGYFLSQNQSLLEWLIGQIILSLGVLQWFSILHLSSHSQFTKNQPLDDLFGLFASIFCLVPYFQWKFRHDEHHQSYLEKKTDPTTSIFLKKEKQLAPLLSLRKFGIPIYALFYSMYNFWNFLNTFKKYKNIKIRYLFFISLLFMQSFFYLATKMNHFLVNWLPGYILFLFWVDQILYKQHQNPNVNQIKITEFFNKYIFFGLILQKNHYLEFGKN